MSTALMTSAARAALGIYVHKGVRKSRVTITMMLETTLVSLICYWIVEWQYLQNLILSYPEIILLLILINLGLGRWTGLRIFEYIRFREVMKHAEE